MAITTGFNLGLMVNGAEGDVHTDQLNAFLRGIDTLVMPVVQALQSDPPSSPTNGQVWAVGSSATGAWATHEGKLARWKTDGGAGWQFFTPKKGWQAVINAGTNGIPIVYDGTAWKTYAALPVHADQAAASALTTGELFRTSAGALMVKL